MQIGLNLSLTGQLRSSASVYAANGFNPALVADFISDSYTGEGTSTFTTTIEHNSATAGNATMTSGYGPELITNGTFDTDLTGWTDGSSGTGSTSWNDAGWADVYGANSSNRGIMWTIVPTVVGKAYSCSISTVSYTSGNAYPIIGTSANGSQLASFSNFNSAQTQTKVFVATTTTTYVTLNSQGTMSFDNISVREMPAIKWRPHNLLTYSEDFSNAAWIKSAATVTANAAVAPDGATTADKLVATAASGGHFVYDNISGSYRGTFSVFAKAEEYTNLRMIEVGSFKYYASFDLETGVVSASGGSKFISASATDVGDGWFLCSITASDIGGAPSVMGFPDGSEPVNTPASYTGDGTSGIYVWGVHLYRSDLGGMAPVPTDFQTAGSETYVRTAGRPVSGELVTNGTFDTDTTGWTDSSTSGGTISWNASGYLNVNSDGVGTGHASQIVSTEVGKIYTVSYDVLAVAGGNVHFYVGTTLAGSQYYSDLSGVGSFSATFTATTTTAYISIREFTAGTSTVDNISVREIDVNPATARYLPRIGHHVYNGSAWVNEGLLHESEARTNLLTYSEDLSNAVWVARDFTKVGTAAGPMGTTAYEFLEDSSSTNPAIYYNANVTDGTPRAFGVWLKASSPVTMALSTQGSTRSSDISVTTEWDFYWVSDSINGAIGPHIGGFNSLSVGSGLRLWVAMPQQEAGSTPSSYIPTAGATVTRSAETLTVPAANLPWPTPTYAAEFEASSWTGVNWDTFTTDGTTFSGEKTTSGGTDIAYSDVVVACLLGEEVYIEVDFAAGTNTQAKIGLSSTTNSRSTTIIIDPSAGGTFSGFFTPNVSSGTFSISVSTTLLGTINVISARAKTVRRSLSIQMDGRMTRASETASVTAMPIAWSADGNNQIRIWHDSSVAGGGIRWDFDQEANNVIKQVSSGYINPFGTLVPFNIASRHGSTFINGAVDGVALTANTTPTALADLSSTDLDLGYDFMGTIGLFRVWANDIGDAGIVEASAPSLEPSLSLTFDGTGTSFTVDDWSE